MASASTLEELLTCPVCQELYTDPQLLVCQHTLCKRCVDQILQLQNHRQSIQCPMCRQSSSKHQIKVDFKMNTFLSTTKSDSLTDIKICDLCQNHKISKECTDCERLLCDNCSNAHREIPNCKEHKLKSLNDIVSKKRSDLIIIRKKIEHDHLVLKQKCDYLETCENDINMICTQLTEKANTWHHDSIIKINEHHHKIVNQIKEIQQNESEDIKKVKDVLFNSKEEINLKLKHYENLENECDNAKFLGAVDELLKCNSSEQLRQDAECILSKGKSSFLHLNYGKQWNEKYGLTLRNDKGQHFNPLDFIKRIGNSQVIFPSNTLNGNLKVKCHFKVDHYAKKILFNDGNIWCLYEKCLEIYTAHGTWLKSVTDNLAHANGMSMVKNLIIIATMGSGLLCYKQSGQMVSILGDGVFCDVTSDNNNSIYCLDYNNNKSKVTKYVKGFFGRWEKHQEIELPQNNLNPCNTMIWNGSSLLVTALSPDYTFIYRIHPSGIILQTHQWQMTVLRICCADANGDVLMADPVNNKLSVFHSARKVKLDLNEKCDFGPTKPYCVTVDNECGIWVSNNTKNIVCYEVV